MCAQDHEADRQYQYNEMLRHYVGNMICSGGDPDVSAKAAGHSKETKARYYKKVNLALNLWCCWWEKRAGSSQVKYFQLSF